MSIKFLSYNIDTNLGRLEDGKFKTIFPQHRIGNRIKYIIDFVKTMDPDIIHFQEGRMVEQIVDSITPLVDQFEGLYHIVVQKYNPSKRAFSYISCFKKSRFNLLDQQPYYLTQSPDESKSIEQEKSYADCPKEELKELVAKWKLHNGFEEFERSVVWHLVEDIVTKNKLVTINCHFGLTREHRFFAPSMLNSLIKGLKLKTEHLIVSGDFNTFIDDGGLEQSKLIDLTDVPLEKYLKDFRQTDAKTDRFEKLEYSSSFHFFPYDCGYGGKFAHMKKDQDDLSKMQPDDQKQYKNKTLEIFKKCCETVDQYPVGCQLDHIYVTDNIVVRNMTMIPVWVGDVDAVKWQNKELTNLILDNDGPVLASDHQPLYCEITL
jgi:exonuclease III